jgi:hypothetical protein
MSPVTIFLARLLGVYCVIIAVSMLVRRRETIGTINAMVADPGQIMLAAVFALFGGLAMVLGHNVWSGRPLTIVVTVVGWIITAKGTMLLMAPSAALARFYRACRYEQLFSLYMVLVLALGGYLAWAGFSGG